MSLNFPNTPTDGERSVQPNGVTYEWQATKERWISITTLGGSVVGGTVVQIQTQEFSEAVNGSNIIPYDDTIPQITEGAEYMAINFTPKYATSVLRIEANANFNTNNNSPNKIIGALFQDAIVDALGATVSGKETGLGLPTLHVFSLSVPAVDIAPRSYSMRYGGDIGGAFSMNADGALAGVFGGVAASSITITEIQPNAIVEPILPSPLEIFINGTMVDGAAGGTFIDLPVPAGVKEIKVGFDLLVQNSTDQTVVQFGTAGGIVTAGYGSTGMRISNAAANVSTLGVDSFPLGDIGNTFALSGIFQSMLMDISSNRWASSGTFRQASTQNTILGGTIALPSEVTFVRITTIAGTAVFTSGSVNIQYDNQGQEATILAALLSLPVTIWASAQGSTAAIFDAGNSDGVHNLSAVKGGTGQYIFTITPALPDSTYNVMTTPQSGSSRQSGVVSSKTASSFEVHTFNASGVATDAAVAVLVTALPV